MGTNPPGTTSKRVMRIAPVFTLSTTLTVAIVGAVVVPTGRPVARIPHPAGSEIVLHVTTTNGLNRSRGSVSVRGDGEAVLQPGLAPGRASPEPLVFRVGEAGVQRTLRAAATAGLLDRPDFGSAPGTQGVVRIETRADHRHRVVSVRVGLDPTSEPALTGPQRRARDSLRRFVHQVLDPSFYWPVGKAGLLRSATRS